MYSHMNYHCLNRACLCSDCIEENNTVDFHIGLNGLSFQYSGFHGTSFCFSLDARPFNDRVVHLSNGQLYCFLNLVSYFVAWHRQPDCAILAADVHEHGKRGTLSKKRV